MSPKEGVEQTAINIEPISEPTQPVAVASDLKKENVSQDSRSTEINIDQPQTRQNLEEIIPVNVTASEFTATNNDSIIEDEQTLSASLTRLTTPNGAEVLIIGTAHFSQKSVQDVQRVIRAVRPTTVVLELCRERAFMLRQDEQSLLEQNKDLSLEKVRNAIREKGVAHGLIYLMFIKMSASLTEKLGMAPGAEFRAGSAEALKIPGCSVILGDRSLRTTIARAVASVSLWQKLKLVYHVLTNDVTITQEEVEKCKDKDMLEQLLEELGGQFPGFKRVLLDERNTYLAHSIYYWAQSSDTSLRPPRVVAIVGIGHVAGIVENWGKTTIDQIRSLEEIPQTSRTEIIVRKAIKYSAMALLIYVGYRVFVPSSLQCAIRERLAN